MPITVKHNFVSAIPDSGDVTIVQPSNWNADHTLIGLGTMAEQDANNVNITGGSVTGVTVNGYIPTTQKGVANGVATLDAGGKVPVSELPAAVLGALNYQGTWNASTNTPTLTSSVGTKGYYYVVNVAGSTNLDGVTNWVVGDWAVFNGSVWQKVDNTDAVTSVNGYTGTVVLGYGDITTGVVPVANGGTGVTVSSGANSVVLRDANQNITVNAVDDNYVNTAASGTQITLTVGSARRYTITGSGGQVIRLPDATTLVNGAVFEFDNNQSSGAITVNNNSNTLVVSVPSGGIVRVDLLSNASAAGSWDRHDLTPANVSWSTNTLDYPGSITSATWNATTVAVNRGGTGATTLTGYVKGSGTSALTASATIPTSDLSGTITNAQLDNSAITINGTSTSLGGSINVGTVTSVTGTSPVVSSGGATPAISMPVATTSISGYLSSTDWNTFNSKGSGSVTSVGLSAPSIFTVSGSPVTGSGTLALSYSGTALPAVNGGTGLTAVGTAGNVLTSNGTTWVSQAVPVATASYVRTSFTATVGQTTFSVTYTAPYIEVYQNGALLNASDYTATNGTSVVLATGASTGDIIETIAYNSVPIGGGGGTPGGSDTQIQFNSSGTFGANANFTYTNDAVNIPFGTSNSATSSAKIALALSMMS